MDQMITVCLWHRVILVTLLFPVFKNLSSALSINFKIITLTSVMEIIIIIMIIKKMKQKK